MSTSYRSILFDRAEDAAEAAARQIPRCFPDLNLDQLALTLTQGRDEYDLAPLLHTPLRRLDAIAYRHEALRDLDRTPLAGHVRQFAKQMRQTRAFLARAGKLHYPYQQRRWFLDAVSVYCDAVEAFERDLSGARLRSAAFTALRRYLAEYARSDRFRSLAQETRTVTADLEQVRYCLLIKDSKIHVRRYDGEPDYSAQVEDAFAKFAQQTVDAHLAHFSEFYEMNHVEAQVLDRVARLYPQQFAALDRFSEAHRDFADATLASFDREAQFCLAYLELVDRLRAAGLAFCYPQLSDTTKREQVRDTFDLVLADKLSADATATVTNDYALRGPERVMVVTGPNQGGKTTFARTFGQLHHLAALGLMVPGSQARLFLPDRVFTHFERPENLADLRGKLLDELIRIHDILQCATSCSVVVLNEIFTSTTLDDALRLSTHILGHVAERDLLAVCVTFIDELAGLGDYTVSMVAGVDPGDQTRRTLKIERRAADGRAYAAALAAKHQLTHEDLRELWSA
jgi:DNA mismatch repair protein MutS